MKGDDYMAREITGAHLDCTKAELRTAFYLFLDDALPTFTCKLIEKRGNYLCGRCDNCMMEQYIKRAKDAAHQDTSKTECSQRPSMKQLSY